MGGPDRRIPFLRPLQVRTDLAIEVKEGLARDIPGMKVDEEKKDNATVSRVHVMSREAEQAMGKRRGTYVTIDAPALRQRDRTVQDEISRILATELQHLLPDGDFQSFVVGLGNWNATPDALGPKVVDSMLVTRHLGDYVPPELRGRLRPVCALAPGVLGLTGIETTEVIMGVVDRLRPDVVIAVDALAARNLNRLLTTIQIADTGVHPGSGVGNKLMAIARETLGVPVIAVGVPTVVDAVTIVHDTVEALVDQFRPDARFWNIVGEMDQAEKRDLISEVLSPAVGNLMVTPKEIDVYMDDMARVVAGGINAALQPGIDINEISTYV